MNIGSVSSGAASFSLSEANIMPKEQVEQLLAGASQVKQQPMQQKMVLMVNQAVQNGHVDVYG